MKIRTVVAKPNQAVKIVTIENELFEYQKIVDGYIEPITVGRNLVALVNEEGTMLGMTPNFSIGYATIVGPAIFVRDTGNGEYESLTDAQVREAKEIVAEGRL